MVTIFFENPRVPSWFAVAFAKLAGMLLPGTDHRRAW
jgi:hypothetical protein